jgi:hypothetical protein
MPRLLLGLLSAALLAACTDKGDTGEACAAEPDLVLADANNYRFQGTLDIQSTSTLAQADLLLDWSGATQDLQGHPMDPAVDVDSVTIVAFPNLSGAEIEENLADNSLLQAEVGAFATREVTGTTSTPLSELKLGTNDINIETYLEEGSASWLLLVSAGSTPGQGTLQIHLVEPLEAETNTDVIVTSTSTVLDFDVDLHSLTPVPTPPATPLTVDWSGVTTDGRGAELDVSDIDRVKVAWFSDTSFADLEPTFLDVEYDADRIWALELESGSSADLSLLTGDEPFDGVSADGTWVLALQCSTCSNPAPLVFTQLLACP